MLEIWGESMEGSRFHTGSLEQSEEETLGWWPGEEPTHSFLHLWLCAQVYRNMHLWLSVDSHGCSCHSSAASYFDALVKVRQLRGSDRAFLSWNDLQAAVSQVNEQVQEETDREWPPQTTPPFP